jgi:hypothetical protein
MRWLGELDVIFDPAGVDVAVANGLMTLIFSFHGICRSLNSARLAKLNHGDAICQRSEKTNHSVNSRDASTAGLEEIEKTFLLTILRITFHN